MKKVEFLVFTLQVLYVCGRGYVVSPRSTAVGDRRPNSIHSKSSHAVFESSPVILAAQHHNLSLPQILAFNALFDSLQKKIAENLSPALSERFKTLSGLRSFLDNLSLEGFNSRSSNRSLVNEYLSKPHACSLR